MGRSRGGLTTKIHALVDADGLPVRLELTAGQAADAPMAEKLLSDVQPGATILADKAYDTCHSSLCQTTQVLGQHPRKDQPQKDIQLQSMGLPSAQSGRTLLQSHQTDAGLGNPIRQTCRQLSRRPQTCSDKDMDRIS